MASNTLCGSHITNQHAVNWSKDVKIMPDITVSCYSFGAILTLDNMYDEEIDMLTEMQPEMEQSDNIGLWLTYLKKIVKK